MTQAVERTRRNNVPVGLKWIHDWRVWLVLAASTAGTIVKLAGGILYGSKALFVDAMTCIANLIALIATIYYYAKTLLPPDLDHHFGHHKLGFAGALVTLVAYSFVAGVVVVDLANIEPYKVSIYAPIYATLGFIFYSIAIIASRKISEYFTPYSSFTVSELIESFTVIIASLLGSMYSYIADYIGAIVITLYLLYELHETTKDMVKVLSDIAPPPNIVEEVKKNIEKWDVRVEKIRLRMIREGYYQGDIIVRLPPNVTVEEAHRIADRIEYELKKRYNIEVTVHVEPCTK